MERIFFIKVIKRKPISKAYIILTQHIPYRNYLTNYNGSYKNIFNYSDLMEWTFFIKLIKRKPIL